MDIYKVKYTMETKDSGTIGTGVSQKILSIRQEEELPEIMMMIDHKYTVVHFHLGKNTRSSRCL